MSLVFGIIVGLLVLTILVALHELGHAYAAKKNGVELEEFGIGFPPKAFSFKKKTDKILPKGTVVSINWLPLGGFVKLKGEHDSDNKKGDYGAASFWGKTQILFAGVAVNWLVAIIIFTILAIFGMPKALDNQFYVEQDARIESGQLLIGSVSEGLPAQKAGLQAGDELVSVAGQKVDGGSKISQITKDNAGKKIDVKFIRNGEEKQTQLEIRKDNSDGKGYAGLSSGTSGEKIYSTWSAPIVGAGTTLQFTGETFKGLGSLVGNFFSGAIKQLNPSEEVRKEGSASMNAAGEGVSGPIGIIGVIFPNAAEAGFMTVLFLAGIISLTLACMNVLPIPALDGGRWLLTFIFRIILKKPLTKETEEKINAYGFLALMLISVLVIALDVSKMF